MLYNAGSPDEWLHSESDKRKAHRWNVPLARKVSCNKHIRFTTGKFAVDTGQNDAHCRKVHAQKKKKKESCVLHQ